MKPRTAVLLLALGVLAVGGAWYLGSIDTETAQRTMAAGQPAFPDLVPLLAQAARIEISHQGRTAVLDRTGDIWALKDHGLYPAEPGKVHDLLVALTELRLIEPRTSDAAEFNRLGLEDPDKPTAESTLLRVLDGAGKPIAALIIGHRRSPGPGDAPAEMYVRKPGEAKTWLAEGKLEPDADPLQWIDRDIASIDHTRIASVTITRDGQDIVLAAENGHLVMKAPAEHPPIDPARLDDVSHALEYLNLDDVRPAAQMPGQPLGAATFVTTDGLAIKVEFNKAEKELWAHVTAAADATKPHDEKAGEAKPGDGKTAKDEAARLEARLSPWSFRIGDWKERALIPTLDDLKVVAPPNGAPPVAPETPK